MSLPFSITPNSINILLEGRMRTLDSTHPQFSKVRDMLKDPHPDLDELTLLVDIPTFVAKSSYGRVQVGSNGTVRFDGEPINGTIVSRMLQMLREGFDVEPLAKFLDKLQDNPVESARNELYLWIEESKLTITPDGNFLAFKKVNDDYTSVYDSTTDNSVGTQPSMDRDKCDNSRTNSCSRGLHFCGTSYLSHFGGARIVIVEVNPADVVAIPNDYNNAKGRAWTYKVVGDLVDNLPESITDRAVVDDYHKPVEVAADWPTCVHPEYKTSFDNPVTGKKVIAKFMLLRVAKHGQRAAALHYGIARSTLQNWIKKATVG